MSGSASDKSPKLLVVSDTGPLHYFVLTGDIALLPKLFGRVLAPQAVHDELANPEAPTTVRAWITQAPAWLEVRPNPDAGECDDSTGAKLDRGEALDDGIEVVRVLHGLATFPVFCDLGRLRRENPFGTGLPVAIDWPQAALELAREVQYLRGIDTIVPSCASSADVHM